MWGVGEHVHWLYSSHPIVSIQILQVASLGSRVAGHIDDALGSSAKNGLDDVRMHACTRGVRDDDIRTAMLLDERVSEDVLHITGKEQGIVNAVQAGVDLGILNGLGYIFYTDDLTRLPGYEVGYGTCARIPGRTTWDPP